MNRRTTSAFWLLVACLLVVPGARAQSTRYSDIALSTRGTPIPNVNVGVCGQPSNTNTQPCSPLASLFPNALLTNPTITSAVRSSGTTTITTSAAHGIPAGQQVVISGVADPSFNGSFTVQSATTLSFSYAQAGPNATSSGGTVAAPNPFQADASGNYHFYAAPGRYTIQVYGPQVSGQFIQPDTLLACDPTGACTHSGAETFSQPIVSTVATGTAPFSVASTTVVPNLNAQLHSGLTAPASAIAGISDTQTLTNKTLTTTSSGNSVTALNAQANGSAVTGTGSAVTLYTYSLPGSTVANLKGFRVNVGWAHTTGSALVTYNLQLNGVNIAHIVNSALNGNGAWVTATVLNTGSATGTVAWSLLDFSLNQVSAGQATTLTGLAWSSSQILQFTFSVANTDQVTPIFWNVELIQ